MRVLFLDMDGVMNCADRPPRNREMGYWEFIDPACVARLNQILDATGAKIVISSSWRVGRDVEDFRHLFKEAGIRGEVIGLTPHLWEEERSHEIGAWLQQHPDVTEYVVLDDGRDANHRGRLVQTTWRRGLEPQHVDRAIDMFNRTDLS